jgi:hypothetical protein
MKMESKITKTETIDTEYNLETEDIEEIIQKHLKLKDNSINFEWHVGQWVRLTVRTKTTKTLTE